MWRAIPVPLATGIFAGAGSAAQTDLGRTTLYKLGEVSTVQPGCFSPCLCPILEQAPLRGTFRLAPAGSVEPSRQLLPLGSRSRSRSTAASASTR